MPNFKMLIVVGNYSRIHIFSFVYIKINSYLIESDMYKIIQTRNFPSYESR